MNKELRIREDWVECSLGDLSVFELGGDWGKALDFQDKNFIEAYCIRGSEFRNWNKERGKTASLRKLKKASVEKRNLRINDILVEISGGGPEQPVGRTQIIDKLVLANFKNSNLVCTNFLRILRPSNYTSSYFLNFYLKYFYSTGKIVRYQAGSNNLRNLKFKDYLTINVPLPPLTEQKAIVKKLETLFSSLDSGIADLKKAQAQLKVYRQAVLKKAFEGELTKASKDIKIVSLGSIIEKPRYGSSKKCTLEIKGKAVLRIPNIGNGIIDTTELKYADFDEKEISTLALREGDILTIRSNGSVSLVGKVALIRKKDLDFLYAGYLIRLRPNKEEIDSKYLLYCLSSHSLRVQIESKAKSTSGVNNINSGELASLMLPLFSLKEQHQIVKAIETRLSVCDQVEKDIADSLKKAKALRQSILKKAFEGKLLSAAELAECKADAAYEPASVLLEKIKAEKQKK